jgi:hypothetical protein
MTSQTCLDSKIQKQSVKERDLKVCPGCGKLQCLCRPRFFAGQLLSEEDLNRLDCYITEKHKLHNRYLHGWGVVCGLDVRCHSCDDHFVTVSSGYALSPCGEDIVVCQEDIVNVCEKINECRDKERSHDPCKPYSYSPDCPEESEDWVLAVRYLERPQRGIVALRHGDSSCHNLSANQNSPRTAPPQCEPSIVSEDHEYEVYRAPSKDPSGDGSKWPHGEMIDRMLSCIDNLTANLPEMSEEVSHTITSDPNIGDNTVTLDSVDEIEIGQLLNIGGYPHEEFVVVQDVDVPAKTVTFAPALSKDFASGILLRIVDMDARYNWCCNLKQAMAQYLKQNPGYNCQYSKILNNITCPDPKLSALEFKDTWIAAFEELTIIFAEIFLSCICSNLLPPCPPPSDESRVPLAVITVSNDSNGCRILRVCNWPTLRKFLTTFPNLQYWLSWLPVMWLLRVGLQNLCCNSKDRLGNWQEKYPKYFKPSQNFSMMAFNAFASKPMNTETLFRGIMGEKDDKEEPIMDILTFSHLPQFMMINQFARPIASGILPAQAKQLLKDLKPMFKYDLAGIKAAVAGLNQIDKLTNQIEGFEKKIEAQAKEIQELKKSIR